MSSAPSGIDAGSTRGLLGLREGFEALERRLSPSPSAWAQACRRAAFARFSELGLPTARLEEWKGTSLQALSTVPFGVLGDAQPADVSARALASAVPVDLGGPRVVFVDGRFDPALSRLRASAHGVEVRSLAEALGTERPTLEPLLAAAAEPAAHALRALNAALAEDGAFVRIPKGHASVDPIELLFVASTRSEPLAFHPRNVVVVDAGAQATVVESYVSLGTQPYLVNAVSDILLADGAILRHVRVQREGAGAFHMGVVRARQGRSSSFSSHAFSLGAHLSRTEIDVTLADEGAECSLDGLYVTSGQQHADHQTIVDHARPHGTSRQLYLGLLDGRSKAVFNGKVVVRKDAQATDARQSNKNLLLSDGAFVDTKPQLEILANDVRCTHGATIGQIRQDAVFYLRSRGIDEPSARAMLTAAFAREVLDRLPLPTLSGALEATLALILAGGSSGKAAS